LLRLIYQASSRGIRPGLPCLHCRQFPAVCSCFRSGFFVRRLLLIPVADLISDLIYDPHTLVTLDGPNPNPLRTGFE